MEYFSFVPDIRVAINYPIPFDESKQTMIILYALPNGNSIEMTAGKMKKPDLDWHYDIQHIAAQTRFLRSAQTTHNILVAYLETKEKSWPAWRQKREKNASDIARIVEFLRFETGYPSKMVFSGHSGGGSFISGFINAFDSIPSFVNRICYLDANYSYDNSLSHGKKLFNWLIADKTRTLAVIAYDDREIVYNGKKVIGPNGGTYRATQRMIHSFIQYDVVSEKQDSTIKEYSSLKNRARFIIHENPNNDILHSVLVEKNGFIHSILLNTKEEERRYTFFGNRAYQHFISAE